MNSKNKAKGVPLLNNFEKTIRNKYLESRIEAYYFAKAGVKVLYNNWFPGPLDRVQFSF